MNNFTSADYAEMAFFYGMANYDCEEAARLYRECLKRDFYPSSSVIRRAITRLRYTGTVMPNNKTIQVPQNRERVLNEIERNPGIGNMGVARQLGLPVGTVRRILQDGNLP